MTDFAGKMLTDLGEILLSVYDAYVDDGWSDTDFDRPSFQRMIADIETKKVNLVITKDLSRMLLNSRKHTGSRTCDFLLKSLIFYHECGYPLGVINRKNTRGEEVLYFVCRTYQRFTKAGVCICNSIKERTVTQAVIEKTREVCWAYLNPEELLPMAQEAVENARRRNSLQMEFQAAPRHWNTRLVPAALPGRPNRPNIVCGKQNKEQFRPCRSKMRDRA